MVEEQVFVCFVFLMGYNVLFIDYGEKCEYVQKILDCCWDIFDIFFVLLLKFCLFIVCYGEVFDEFLVDEVCVIIVFWDLVLFIIEQ